MAGWKGACRSLAVYPDLFRLVTDRVLLEFGDVVAHVVDQVHLHGLPRLAEDLGEYITRLLHQKLAIAPREVGGGTHGGDILFTFGAVDGSAGELAVGKRDAVLFRGLAQQGQGVVA